MSKYIGRAQGVVANDSYNKDEADARYATTSQGSTADSAVQPGDNVSGLTNDSGFISGYTVTQGDVTAHQAALSITESQVSDLGDYATNTALTNAINNIDALPSQTGNAGQYLTTDGTNASWSTVTQPTLIQDLSNVFSSTSDPTATTNPSGGTGSVWINKSSGEAYICTNATTNQNVWINIGQGSGNIQPPVSAELLLIAGGGGGGPGPGEGGGGGAGGLLYYGSETPKTPNGPALSLARGITYSVTIGGGGTGASGYTSVTNSNGTNSSFTGVTTAVGGGRGGLYPSAGVGNGGSGGSGGGGGGNSLNGGGSQTGGSGTNGQGNAGGNGVARGNYGNGIYGAGGGGAGSVGTTPTSSPGNGGIGLQYSITGPATYYAGGGAGNTNGTDDGSGAAGGGGNVDTAGSSNSGGGGGSGSSSNGGNGGSGVAILRIPTADYTGTTSGNPSISTSGSYTIIRFTQSGSYTA